MDETTGMVNYSVKELLARQDVRLERIERYAESAASKEDLAKIDGRVTRLEAEGIRLQAQLGTKEEIGERTFERHDKYLAALLLLTNTAIAAGALWISVHP